MAWIEYGVVDLSPVPGDVLIGTGNVMACPSLTSTGLSPKTSRSAPPQNKDVFRHTIIVLVRGTVAAQVKLNVECLHAPHWIIGEHWVRFYFPAVPQNHVCLLWASNGVFRLRLLQESGQWCFQPRGDLPKGCHCWNRLAAFDLA